jgi:hypothetical protein
MPRAEELSALVEATPAEEVDVLEAAAQELRELRDRLTDADDIAAWTPAADDGFTAACAKLGQVRPALPGLVAAAGRMAAAGVRRC